MPKNMSGSEATLLRQLRRSAYRAQGGRCFWCQEPMKRQAEQGDPLLCTGDHLIPLHRGGRTIPGNIVAACRKCNNERHPELKSLGGGIVASVGNDALRSPFSVLEGWV